MSVLDEEEFVTLRKYKGKINLERVSTMLDLIEEELKRSNNVKTAIIYVFANNVEEVRSNKEIYETISRILERFAPKLGFENVSELIKSSLS